MSFVSDILPFSRYLSRLLAASPALAEDAAASLAEAGKPLITAEMLRGFLFLSGQASGQPLPEEELKPALRRLKQRAYARIATRDLAGLASLAEVTEGMTLLAEVAIQTALASLDATLKARYGAPRNAKGDAQQLIVIGMGKLGGRELNVSSDIDLIFLYPEDGETDGVGSVSDRACRPISNFDYFTRLGRGLINAIADLTSDGQVFRVDMRLRPNGDSGPLACSFDMLENYFFTQGREWERYAWIKARPVSVLADPGERNGARSKQEADLESIRLPFVFRKYFDFSAIEALRNLHVQIRREVVRKDMAGNIKLGPGGIREIEFIAQVFQLIRGGRDAKLQARPTLQVLSLLAERGTLATETVRELSSAYDFLRRLEHRLQYLDDAQTHSLPANAEDQATIARAMSFASYDAMLAELDDHRANVSRHFEAVFADPNEPNHDLDPVWQAPDNDTRLLAGLGYRDAPSAAQRLAEMRASNRYQQMPASTRERFDALVPRVIEVCAQTPAPNPDETLTRCLDLLETISRRAAYLALLLQYPQALRKVAQLVGASSWAADYLQRHPILLDELLDASILEAVPDWSSFRKQLESALDAEEPDTERQMDMLRDAHHAQIFRLLTQDLSDLLPLEKLSDHLSELADIMLDLALAFAWRKLSQRHVEKPRFAVISYGKLGGKELGYMSDLDLVFLYDDPAAEAQENYSRLAMRLNSWLSSQTRAGMMYETDMRLRPNGESGLIVNSIESFLKYQLESAWMWEHQALTRARFSAGDRAVGDKFEQIRIEVLRQQRDLDKLKQEVLAMRQKMLDAHAGKSAQFDLKQDKGGLIDVEFIIQYLVLGHSHDHPELTGNLGNIALLRISAELGLIPAALAESVRNAYREYRRMQHQLSLNHQPLIIEPALATQNAAAVRELWRVVFGDENA